MARFDVGVKEVCDGIISENFTLCSNGSNPYYIDQQTASVTDYKPIMDLINANGPYPKCGYSYNVSDGKLRVIGTSTCPPPYPHPTRPNVKIYNTRMALQFINAKTNVQFDYLIVDPEVWTNNFSYFSQGDGYAGDFKDIEVPQ